jgi:hypothetical protein
MFLSSNIFSFAIIKKFMLLAIIKQYALFSNHHGDQSGNESSSVVTQTMTALYNKKNQAMHVLTQQKLLQLPSVILPLPYMKAQRMI